MKTLWKSHLWSVLNDEDLWNLTSTLRNVIRNSKNLNLVFSQRNVMIMEVINQLLPYRILLLMFNESRQATWWLSWWICQWWSIAFNFKHDFKHLMVLSLRKKLSNEIDNNGHLLSTRKRQMTLASFTHKWSGFFWNDGKGDIYCWFGRFRKCEKVPWKSLICKGGNWTGTITVDPKNHGTCGSNTIDKYRSSWQSTRRNWFSVINAVDQNVNRRRNRLTPITSHCIDEQEDFITNKQKGLGRWQSYFIRLLNGDDSSNTTRRSVSITWLTRVDFYLFFYIIHLDNH